MMNKRRVSEYLTLRQVHHVALGGDFAYYRDFQLNRFISINLEKAGVQARGAQRFISRFTKLAGDWLNRNKAARAYVWVLENKGVLNAHLLMHVPENMRGRFAQLERSWFVKSGGTWIEGALHSEQLPNPDGSTPGRSYTSEFCAVMHYMLKGIDPRFSRETGVRSIPQGSVEGKRCGVSETLGTKARFESVLPYAWETEFGIRPRRPIVLDCKSPEHFQGKPRRPMLISTSGTRRPKGRPGKV